MAAPSPSVPFKFEGKTALITGAGSGISLCFAKALVARKCNVLIADLALRPEAQQFMDDNQSNPKVAFVKTDVRNWKDLSNMFDVAEKEFGGVDVVCPGAGVYEPLWSSFLLPPGHEKSKDDPLGADMDGVGHYASLDINLTHVLRSTQLAISHWLNPSPDSKAGKASPANPKRVICITSVAGQCPGFSRALYCTSKHAVSGFIYSMAPLETMGIRVNGVAPGLIKTPLWTDHPEKLATVTEQDTWILPEEVAEQMIRCAEDDSIGAGIVWEVLKDTYRSVDWHNADPPTGPGSGLSDAGRLAADALALLAEPGWGVVKK